MARHLFHPSNRRLRIWLETGGTRRVTQHVERCDHCADRLERLDQVDRARTAGRGRMPIGDALRTLWVTPDDLTLRVTDGLQSWRDGHQDLELFAELFSVGVDTARLITPPAPPSVRDDPAPDGDPDQADPDSADPGRRAPGDTPGEMS